MTNSSLLIRAVAAALAAAALALPGTAAAGGSVSIGVGVYGPGYGVYAGPRYYGPRPYYGPGPYYYYGPRWYGPAWYGPGPYWYAPPVYVYPPVTVVPAQPPVYVERDEPASRAAPLESGFWYYCRDPAGYYPTVRECPGGWEKVPPRPPGTQ